MHTFFILFDITDKTSAMNNYECLMKTVKYIASERSLPLALQVSYYSKPEISEFNTDVNVFINKGLFGSKPVTHTMMFMSSSFCSDR